MNDKKKLKCHVWISQIIMMMNMLYSYTSLASKQKSQPLRNLFQTANKNIVVEQKLKISQQKKNETKNKRVSACVC